MNLIRQIPLAVGLAAGLLLAGCEKSPVESIAAAKTLMAKQDWQSARIELQNALQQEPGSAEARYLLGQTLLEGGAAKAAVVELNKAKDLNHPPEQVLPLLARAELADGSFQKVVKDYGGKSLATPQATADLQTSVAVAAASTGDAARAREAVSAALAAVPDFVPAWLVQARLIGGAGQVDDALALLGKALAKEPANTEALLLKGNLELFGKSNAEAALQTYRRALEGRPDSVAVRSALVSALLMRGEVASAQKEFEALQKVNAKHPQTMFFDALFAYHRNDHKAAREILQQLQRLSPDNPRLLVLAGMNELRAGSFVQAEALLAKAVQLAPQQPAFRRELAEAYLRRGQATRALEVLKPVLERPGIDARVLHTAALAYMQSGNLDVAEGMFRRAAKMQPGSVKIDTGLALAQLAKGDSQAAFAALNSVAAADTSGAVADMALISAHIKRREYDAALAAIARLQQKQPDDPLPLHLRGRVLLAKKDRAGARASLERAVALRPTYLPAVAQLASMDWADKRPEQARARFEAVLKADPKRYEAYIALAEIAAKSGAKPDEVDKLFVEAAKVAPSEPGVRRAHVDYLLSTKRTKQALAAAQSGVAALPEDPVVLDALGRAQVADGQEQQALATFGKLASLQTGSVTPLLRLAGLQAKRGDMESTATTLQKALDIAPHSPVVHQGLLALASSKGGWERAQRMARQLQDKAGTPAGYALEGDMFAMRKEWAAAREAYGRGVGKVARSELLAPRIHQAWLAEGRAADAERFAADWTRKHPDDAGFHFHLGSVLLVQKEFGKAEQQFARVVKLKPADVPALNNLAWLLVQQRKPGALEYARRAQALAPNSADVLDTLAHALAQSGDMEAALRTQQEAVDAAPSQPRFQLSLAKLQLSAGNKAAAKSSLEALVKRGRETKEFSEAERLLASM